MIERESSNAWDLIKENNETKAVKDIECHGGEYSEYLLTQNAAKIKVLGRSLMLSNGLACDGTGSGIAFRAYIENSVTVSITATAQTFYTVFVDGVRLDEKFEVNGSGEIRIDGLGSNVVREIEIVKQTEPQLSLAVIEKISFNGTLEAVPEDRALYIEFIGDSITGGYGNLCDRYTENAHSAQYQEGTKTYAYLTARALDADFCAVNCSGIGVQYGYTSNPEKPEQFNMGDYYPRISFYRSKSDMYDFASARKPDIVVINLGTNDQNCNADVEDFKAAVRSLIKTVRANYGQDTPIVWVYNMMLDGYFTYTRTVLDDMGGERAGLYCVEMVRNTDGGDTHCSEAAHKVAADTLTAFLKKKGLVN